MRTRTEFKFIWKRVQRDTVSKSLWELSRMLRSRSADVRLYALFKIREQLNTRLRKGYFALARRSIVDPDNDCRWQALIVVGEFVESNPTRVWRVVMQYGVSKVADIRTAVATVLLEHLLEHHFTQIFPRARRLAVRSREFADTLSRSGNFIRGRRNIQRFQDLVRALSR
jgi:hypothetical protein